MPEKVKDFAAFSAERAKSPAERAIWIGKEQERWSHSFFRIGMRTLRVWRDWASSSIRSSISKSSR